MKTRTYEVKYTHHGPILARRGEYHVSLTPLHQPAKELEQEWKTMKAAGLEDYKEVMSIRSNATNNTVYADVDGNIAYWNGNFVPKRNPDHNWQFAVPSAPENDWMGIHPLEEIIQVISPESGYIQNCNSTPYLAAGADSPKAGDYPDYMTGHHHNPRAANAIRLLEAEKAFTPEKFREMTYDNYLQLFDLLLPRLFKAYDNLPKENTMKAELNEAITLLKSWDQRVTENADQIILAENYARTIARNSEKYIPEDTVMNINMESFPTIVVARDKMSDEDLLQTLKEAQEKVMEEYGTLKIPLSDVYRFQRLSDHPTIYDEDAPSLPSTFLSSFYGSLAAGYYNSPEGSKEKYFAGGNSFVAVIEFDKDQVQAWSILGGGQSADPSSPHYTDQAEMFMNGEMKKVFFTREDVMKNKESEYHPGETRD